MQGWEGMRVGGYNGSRVRGCKVGGAQGHQGHEGCEGIRDTRVQET